MVQIFETQHQPSALELFAQGLGGGLSQEMQAQRESDRKLQNLQREMQLYQPYLNDLSQGVENKLNEGLGQRQQAQPNQGFPTPPRQVPPITEAGKRINDLNQKKYENDVEQYKITSKQKEDQEKLAREKQEQQRNPRRIISNIKDLKELLPYTGNRFFVGKGPRIPILNREAIQKREEFDNLAFTLEGFLREMATKGQLPQGTFNKLLEKLPDAKLSDRANIGRMDAILKDIYNTFPELKEEATGKTKRPLESFYE